LHLDGDAINAAQNGSAQQACKDQAENDYKTARSDARAGAEAAEQQK
jgi:hypothetical protein